MIQALLPPGAVAVERLADVDGVLFAAESAALGRAVEKRRREFTTARICAREALARLGAPAGAVGARADGMPLWPPGVVGSITHCEGYRACAVARARQLSAVGIDAEPHAPLPDGVLDAISRPHERRLLASLQGDTPGVHWERILFSAKESLYKALCGLAPRPLSFHDAIVRLWPGGRFEAELPAGEPPGGGRAPARCRGRWRAGGGLVLTAVTLG